jgi:hypothetical protein
VVGRRVSIRSQNKKITAARPSDPTPNKGDAGSLTIVTYDTGPLISVSRQTVRGLLKISPRILTIIPMEFLVKGTPVVSLNIVMRAVHIRLLARRIHNARILPTTVATRPTRLRRSLPAAALIFSSPTAPCMMTVTRTQLLACGRTSSRPT